MRTVIRLFVCLALAGTAPAALAQYEEDLVRPEEPAPIPAEVEEEIGGGAYEPGVMPFETIERMARERAERADRAAVEKLEHERFVNEVWGTP